MQARVQLSIPQPCHEDWHHMTPSEKGRFCSVCTKEVVDFTSMSDTEVLHFFLDNKNEKVCGRVYPDQLHRPVAKPVYPQKNKWWYWNYAAMLLFFFQKSASAKIHGGLLVTHNKTVKRPAPFSTKTLYRFSQGNMLHVKTTVTGKITDDKGTPLSGASIVIKGSNVAAVSDSKGIFRIEANTDSAVLTASYVGFETAQLTLKNLKSYTDIEIILKPQMLGGLAVVGGLESTEGAYSASVLKHVAVIEVLDNATHKPIIATVTVVKNGYMEKSPVTTDAKGLYKLKRIREDDSYKVSIEAGGYLPSTLDIKGWMFNDRKETRYVFLEKAPAPGDFKNLEAVTVTGYENNKKICVMLGGISSVTTIRRTYTDTLNLLKTKLAGSLRIAPNPVQKGGAFNLLYTVKESGTYLIQITDAAGLLVHQQQVAVMQKNGSLQIQTAASWSSGVYYLRLSNAENKLLSTNSFIVQ